jgi:viroplasmin and RNaseH domain-containing protein
VTVPEKPPRIYETWAETEKAVKGVTGGRRQSVDSLEKAKLMIGEGIVLSPGLYAFTDGNAAGGVGVVVVRQATDDAQVVHEASVSVRQVFTEAGILHLESEAAVELALRRLHNILAELARLYHALSVVEAVP